MPCVLVSCCGLPAAGKTTFCRSVTKWTKSSTTTSTTSARTDAHSNTAHMVAETLMAPAGATTASTSSTKYFNRVRAGSVFRVHHVCFDEHISHARQRHQHHLPSSRQPLPRTRVHHSREGEARGESQQQGHEDRDKNASIRTGTESDNTDPAKGAAVDADAMQHADLAGDEEDTARWWHEGRREAMSVVEMLLAETLSRALNVSPAPGPVAGAFASAERTKPEHDEEEGKKHQHEDAEREGSDHETTVTDVVIADDNMHFRSMRHELLCLARKHGCGYAQVYFPTDVEVALERNRGRTGSVPEAVIRKMAGNIQPPDPERFKWERHTSVIEPQGFRLKVRGVLDRDNKADALGHLGRRWASSSLSGTETVFGEDASANQSFWRVIATAAEDPVPPLPVPSTIRRQQESDRAATKANFLHQLDLELRESVKRVADKAADASLTGRNLRAVMAACAVSKKTSLCRAKGGHWTQPGDFASSEDTTDRKEKTDHYIEDSSSSINCSSCVHGEDEGGKMKPVCLSPMQEFCLEFKKALSGFSWLDSSVRRELVEAARRES